MEGHSSLAITKCKLKLQWGITIYLSKKLAQTLMTSNSGKDAEKVAHSYIAGENAKWDRPLEKFDSVLKN